MTDRRTHRDLTPLKLPVVDWIEQYGFWPAIGAVVAGWFFILLIGWPVLWR